MEKCRRRQRRKGAPCFKQQMCNCSWKLPPEAAPQGSSFPLNNTSMTENMHATFFTEFAQAWNVFCQTLLR